MYYELKQLDRQRDRQTDRQSNRWYNKYHWLIKKKFSLFKGLRFKVKFICYGLSRVVRLEIYWGFLLYFFNDFLFLSLHFNFLFIIIRLLFMDQIIEMIFFIVRLCFHILFTAYFKEKLTFKVVLVRTNTKQAIFCKQNNESYQGFLTKKKGQ